MATKEEIFDDAENSRIEIIESSGYVRSVSVEDLFQAFKQRLSEELADGTVDGI